MANHLVDVKSALDRQGHQRREVMTRAAAERTEDLQLAPDEPGDLDLGEDADGAMPTITQRPPSFTISVAWRNVCGRPIASSATSTPAPPVNSRTAATTGRRSPAFTVVVGAELAGQLQLVGGDVDGDDPVGARARGRPG